MDNNSFNANNISSTDATERMKELISRLRAASEAYYNGRGEAMSDYEWDRLFDELKHLEDETGTVLPESPTHNVQADTTAGKKEAHEYPALSLAKTKNPAELVKWAGGRPIWLSWKLDGLTLVVTFDGGRLTKVVTRGDGHTGTNITHLSKAINGIPQTVPDNGHIVIRGECVISYKDFNDFILESGDDYANPRNLASGSLTLKDIDEVRRRHLTWIPFTLVHTDKNIDTWGARMDYIEKLGMKAVDREYIIRPTLEAINAVISKWTAKVTGTANTAATNPYPVDGLVIAYDDYKYSQTGSVTGHHATRAGFAFKWQDESATTELEKIEWSCAASTISPVAVFKPVELEGTTVRRASLCNISECERLGIGGHGTQIRVIKANKIIPKIISIEKAEGELDIPAFCPVCGSPTKIVTSSASGTKTLHCTNESCPAKQLKKFARFVSKEGMNIDGISKQTLARFVNEGWIKSYADIFRLDDHTDAIAHMDGFGEKSAANIKTSIGKARQADARHFLYALSIPIVGQDVANRLLGVYPLNVLINTASETDNPEEFAKIAGIGPEKSATVVRWFHNKENLADTRQLLSMINISQEDNRPKGDKCNGLTFVITGDVYHYKNRSELKAYIESQGGKVTGSVSKSTSFLINNDVTSTSGKNMKARQLGIPVISEDEFIERYGNNGQ